MKGKIEYHLDKESIKPNLEYPAITLALIDSIN